MNTRSPHSPPGTIPETRHPTEQPDAAAPNARQPGGDTIPDMLGGEARPAVSHRYKLPANMDAQNWRRFANWIDAELADGVSGRALCAANQMDTDRRGRMADFDGPQWRLFIDEALAAIAALNSFREQRKDEEQ
jgi:hypothetical protein